MTRRSSVAACRAAFLPHAPAPAGTALGGAAGLAMLLVAAAPARAVPSFALQTGQECAACHVGAFGPQLTPYGREFKLEGYVESARSGFHLPLAAMAIGSFTHTGKGQSGGAAPHFGDNDNLALDQLSVFYGGKIAGELGAFVQGTYDGVGHETFLDNADVRFAHGLEVGEGGLVLGIDVNNNPTVQDPWNTTPAWSFPYVASALAPTPTAAPLVAGGLAQGVFGTSAYAWWRKTVYAEAGLYLSPSKDLLRTLGESDPGELDGAAPYWRLAFNREWSGQAFELGTFGLYAPLKPDRTGPGRDDNYTDLGFDASYQFLGTKRHVVSVNLTDIVEWAHLDASHRQGDAGKNGHTLNAINANVSYYYNKTWGVTLGFFDVRGDKDTTLYAPGAIGGSRTGSPDSRGFIVQGDWTPFGKEDSWLAPWVNLRLGVQYTAYTEFNGSSSDYDGSGRSASDNDTVFVFAWLAF